MAIELLPKLARSLANDRLASILCKIGIFQLDRFGGYERFVEPTTCRYQLVMYSVLGSSVRIFLQCMNFLLYIPLL